MALREKKKTSESFNFTNKWNECENKMKKKKKQKKKNQKIYALATAERAHHCRCNSI